MDWVWNLSLFALTPAQKRANVSFSKSVMKIFEMIQRKSRESWYKVPSNTITLLIHRRLLICPNWILIFDDEHVNKLIRDSAMLKNERENSWSSSKLLSNIFNVFKPLRMWMDINMFAREMTTERCERDSISARRAAGGEISVTQKRNIYLREKKVQGCSFDFSLCCDKKRRNWRQMSLGWLKRKRWMPVMT